ncbi:MAG: hypothetical protein GC200_11290 [Tepidisphaera sp.]|nr:hypothetical protein [Tepidisphaera sp.]
MSIGVSLSFAGALVLVSGSFARAQYQPEVLNPDGASESFITAAGGGVQVGFAAGSATGGNSHGFIWNGTPQSAIDVNPQGIYEPTGVPFSGSFLYGAGGGQQVGLVIAGVQNVATVWSGTAASAAFLATPLMLNSVAYGTDGVSQVGSARVNDPSNGVVTHAYAWQGTPESAVDIHPDFALESFANRVRGNVAVGTTATFDEFYNAVVWTSVFPPVAVSLHPSTFLESVATDLNDSIVVGYGYPDGLPNHALVWSLAGGDPTDVHPAGYFSSFIYATNADSQVGIASTPRDADGNNHEHAFAWTPSGTVDLHEALVAQFPQFTDSNATGIDAAGNVYGHALDTNGIQFAVAWTIGGNACNPDVNQDGVADQGDVDYLINVIAGGENPTGIDADFNQDGVADQGDIDALINVVAGGSCP